MNKLLEGLIDTLTPWRNKKVEQDRHDRTHEEVVRAEVGRNRLMSLSESYRIADIIFEERAGTGASDRNRTADTIFRERRNG